MSGQELRKKPTPQQARILDLITKKGCWPAEVSRRLKISRAAVSKHLTNLKKMGLIGGVNTGGVNNRRGPGGVPENVNPLRLHAEQFRLEIISSSMKYHETRARTSSVLLDGNRIVLHRDVLVVYSYQSFYGETVDECDAEAGEYWLRFFHRLESLYGLLLLKERKENMKRVKAHYAEMNNELARDLRKKGQRVRVFGSADRKEWLVFDDSHALDEMETTHTATVAQPQDAREDMELIREHMNDIRDHRPPLPSQQQAALAAQTEMLTRVIQAMQVQTQLGGDMAQSLNAIAKVMEAQLRAQNPEPSPPEPFPAKKPDYFG